MDKTQEIQLILTREEFDLVKNFLIAKRIYKPYGEKWGHQIWRPFMESFLAKLENIASYLD